MQRRAFGSLLMAAGASVLGAGVSQAQLVRKYAEQLRNGEFNWFPERSSGGPILIIVSLPDQLVHVYRNGIRIAATTCATGKPGHATPTGVFKILQKDKHHRSSTYDNASMPNTNRLTWSGIALHAGSLPGYPNSHGCVHLPFAFSERLFEITRLGMTVVIADEHSQPQSVVHPGLVLGDYARKEFHAVDASMMRAAYSEGHTERPINTSIVVSKHDDSMTLFDGDQQIAQGKVDFEGKHRVIGTSVYTLANEDRAEQGLRWIATNQSRKASGVASPAALGDIRAKPELHEKIRRSLHPGATLVVTDEPVNAKTHSAGGFTVIDTLY